MIDALRDDALLLKAATDAASVAARAAASMPPYAERIKVVLSSDRRREHAPELRARLVAG